MTDFARLRTPLSLGALHAVVCERIGRSFPRPTMAFTYELSRGNPFYAIELARVIDSRSRVGEVALPRTLSETSDPPTEVSAARSFVQGPPRPNSRYLAEVSAPQLERYSSDYRRRSRPRRHP